MNNDLAGVHACIQAYFDGLYEGDCGLLFDLAFDPAARMYAADVAGERIEWDMAQFRAVIEGRKSPAETGYPRKERIVAIDFAGPDTALVKVEVLVGKRDFTDQLNLLRIDGTWKIISKVYCLSREFETKEQTEAAASG